ncbi:MAG: hypothetical protein F6K11_07795 [Leptolyngbya sp. SIO3F4]|nr:hypothetical protein [Leptolyngbya sp. SIO3F4]
MSNLLQAEVHIQGTRPLLINHLRPSLNFGRRKAKMSTPGNDPAEWTRTVLMTEERQLYLLPSYVFGCFRDAGQYTKRGRGSLMPLIPSTLQVKEQRILLDRYLPKEPRLGSEELNEPAYVFMAVTRGGSGRGKNIRYRVAAAPGWQCQFTLVWDKTVVSKQEMQAVAIDAGRLVGLADGRSIGYGRFEITQFDVSSIDTQIYTARQTLTWRDSA